MACTCSARAWFPLSATSVGGLERRLRSTCLASAPPARPTTAPQSPKLIPNKCLPEPDFTLVSADNKSFKVSSSRLKKVSPVFRAIGDAGTGDKLEFTDDVLESGDIVLHFLLLAGAYEHDFVSMTFDSKMWRHDIERLERLIAFLDKYDCNVLKDRLMDLVLWRSAAFPPLTAFILCAQAGDVAACVEVLDRESTFWSEWGPWEYRHNMEVFESDNFKGQELCSSNLMRAMRDPKKDISFGSASHYHSDCDYDFILGPAPAPAPFDNMFNPGCLPRSLWVKIPEEYTYALTRGWHISGGNDPRKLSKAFARLMGHSNIS